MYYTYMLRCEGGYIYTGITTDLKRRFSEHACRASRCAKYTLSHKALKFEAAWETDGRQAASRLEYRIKKIDKSKKEDLISGRTGLEELFGDKLKTNRYSRLSQDELNIG